MQRTERYALRDAMGSMKLRAAEVHEMLGLLVEGGTRNVVHACGDALDIVARVCVQQNRKIYHSTYDAVDLDGGESSERGKEIVMTLLSTKLNIVFLPIELHSIYAK